MPTTGVAESDCCLIDDSRWFVTTGFFVLFCCSKIKQSPVALAKGDKVNNQRNKGTSCPLAFFGERKQVPPNTAASLAINYVNYPWVKEPVAPSLSYLHWSNINVIPFDN